jgi:hypothetical protein
MRRLACLVPLVLLGGCPPPPHYLITDVTTPRGPVSDALVAADCDHASPTPVFGPAMRTDQGGRARLLIPRSEATGCAVTVAKPGYATVEVGAVSVCTTAACPPTTVELHANDVEAPVFRPRSPREYAPPPPLGLGTASRPISRSIEVAR